MLRLAAVPVAVAFCLGVLGTSAAEGRASRAKFRPSLRFQENYKDKLFRIREDGDSWLEQYTINTYKVKAVVPIDRDLVDVDTFDGDTEFQWEIGEAYYSGTLSEDPNWAPGKRSARIAFETEEIWWGPDEEFYRERAVGIAKLQWTEDHFTMAISLRPYLDPEYWDEDGSFIVALNWTEMTDGSDPDGYAVRETAQFQSELLGAPIFQLGAAFGVFADEYSGIGTSKSIVVGSGDDAEEFVLESVRLKGAGDLVTYEDDGGLPTIGVDVVEVDQAAGVPVGVYVTGTATDAGLGVYAIVARVDGGPPQVIWASGVEEGIDEAFFDGYLDVAQPSGEVVLTVYDLAKNSASITIPYGE